MNPLACAALLSFPLMALAADEQPKLLVGYRDGVDGEQITALEKQLSLSPGKSYERLRIREYNVSAQDAPSLVEKLSSAKIVEYVERDQFYEALEKPQVH